MSVIVCCGAVGLGRLVQLLFGRLQLLILVRDATPGFIHGCFGGVIKHTCDGQTGHPLELLQGRDEPEIRAAGSGHGSSLLKVQRETELHLIRWDLRIIAVCGLYEAVLRQKPLE